MNLHISPFFSEVVLKTKLDADPDYVTSMRYLSTDYKNPVVKLVINFCRKKGVLGKDELFDPQSMLALVVFVASQFVYTILTILHPPILFKSYELSCAYLVIIFTAAVWNGASYYIEVFSKRYNLKFVHEVSKSDDRKESIISLNEGHEEHDDEFTEALDSLDLEELFEDLIDDDTASTTSSRGDEGVSPLRSREGSEEPTLKPEEIFNHEDKNNL